MYHFHTTKQTEGAPAGYPNLEIFTPFPEEAITLLVCLCYPWQNFPAYFSLKKRSLIRRVVSKSLLTQVVSSAFRRAAQAGLPLARIGS